MLLDDMRDHFGLVGGVGRMDKMSATQKRRFFGPHKTGEIRRFRHLRRCSGEMALVPDDDRIGTKCWGVTWEETPSDSNVHVGGIVGWILVEKTGRPCTRIKFWRIATWRQNDRFR